LSLDNEDQTAESLNIMDDPSHLMEGQIGPITCVANFDYIAKTDEELMFMKDEVINVLEKLGNGFYLGECKGVKGVFRGNFVSFKKILTSGTNAGKASVLIRKDSQCKLFWSHSI
jgi:hypothetical protein